MHKNYTNHNLSLFTINEQLRKLSNDIIKRNSNNTKNVRSNHNSNSKKRQISDRRLTKQVMSFSSKLFQLKRPTYVSTKPNNIKPINSPKSKVKITQIFANHTQTNGNQLKTNNNYSTNANTNTISNKRNGKRERYLPSPKRFLSLTKDRNQKKTIKSHYTNINIIATHANSNNNIKKYPIYSNIKESNLRSFQTHNNNKKYSKSGSKSNSLTKNHIKNSNYLSNSNSHKKYKEQSAYSTNTIHNIKDSKSKDCILPKTSQNSFLSKAFLQSANHSSENFNIKEKNKIKVNRKKSTQKEDKKHQTNIAFINQYSSYLTQKEVNDLQTFTHGIYYTDPFDRRKTNNMRYNNQLTSTYSYINCPNYTYTAWPRCNSYKSFNEIYILSDNYEYDDNEGNYNLIQGDHLLYRYEIVHLLGTGSFGQAVRCLDHKTNQIVCIKIIKANPRFYVQALMEIKILEEIKEADVDNESNVVKLLSHFVFRSHIVRNCFINS